MVRVFGGEAPEDAETMDQELNFKTMLFYQKQLISFIDCFATLINNLKRPREQEVTVNLFAHYLRQF